MKCEKAMEKFLEQDDGRRIPIAVMPHVLFCSKCRMEMVKLSNIFYALRGDSPYKTADMTSIIMRSVSARENQYHRDVSLWQWLVAGAVICSGIIIVNYSLSFLWLKGHFGRDLEIPLNIIWGFIIIIYIGSFVGTHIDNIKKAIEVKFRFKI